MCKTTLSFFGTLLLTLNGCSGSDSNGQYSDEFRDSESSAGASSGGASSTARGAQSENGAGSASTTEACPVCSTEPVVPLCTPGASVACACADGANGAQTCGADGKLAACVCAKPVESFPECFAMSSFAGGGSCRADGKNVYPYLNCKTNPNPSKCVKMNQPKTEPDLGLFCCEM
jgi:hypothetical protein